MDKTFKEKLENQQYRVIGNNTAVKICTWTKKSLRDEGVCYKEKFYGIKAHRCCQMTPTLGYCPNHCIFCWRIYTKRKDEMDEFDNPDLIIKECPEKQQELLEGFYGYDKVNRKKLDEAQEPMHYAISLTGEPTMYPELAELIKKLHEKGKTTFLVTNGLFPERIEELYEKDALPTQLYISLDAPNEELWKKIDRSIIKNGWEKVIKNLKQMKKLKKKTRTTIRITAIKGINMIKPEEWAEKLNIANPEFIEVKGYMFIGDSRKRMKKENMPFHKEVKEFAEEICKNSDYNIIDEQESSRVVLLMKKDTKDRIMKF
ncbi:4-demethylwyosine synthase TYW1 [Candidatus Woesearchaeota archaeon]|nr:4-demethylwyosine synthase TYW1 [Candidatus Woesearchaeota archaeon]